MTENSALVLEGGGMRGAYTTGVLDFFLEQNLDFPACYAVSAGSGHACSFLSKQRGRAFRVNVDYLDDWRYCGWRTFLTTGCYFGTDFIYKTIPTELNAFDYEAFRNKKTRFFAVLTNVETGLAEYLPVDDLQADYPKIVASSSLPFISKIVKIGGKKYLDGGIADSIPVRKALSDGYRKPVVILTQHDGYRKAELTLPSSFKLYYGKYPAFVKAAIARPGMYNETLDFVRRQEAAGNIFVIRPQQPVSIGRLETDKKKLKNLHKMGHDDAKRLFPKLLEYLNSDK